jgi:hypothetical protein
MSKKSLKCLKSQKYVSERSAGLHRLELAQKSRVTQLQVKTIQHLLNLVTLIYSRPTGYG